MTSLIIGSLDDGHVQAVVHELAKVGVSKPPLIIDAPALQNTGFSLDLDEFRHGSASIPFAERSHGWLRRYAPSLWGAGGLIGSRESVTNRAFLALLGSISRLGFREWLTPLDKMLAAEDRLLQLQVARSLGVRVPSTIITSSADEAVERLGSGFVVKPLAGGYYWTDDGPKAVFTTELGASEAHGVNFGAAPFVAQARVRTIEHLRAVTVGDQVWVARLSARDRPLDWRRQEEAHLAWSADLEPQIVGPSALHMASALGIGYSSQDWVRDDDGVVFLDLNPGGQWLFLPDPVASSVTHAIAVFLAGGPA